MGFLLPLVLGVHLLAPVTTHALFIHRAATVLRSRPVSLSFATLILPPQEALDSASSPTFFSLCFFCRDIRNTIYDIRFVADAVATNSNLWRNIRPYQDTSCSPAPFISKIIQKSNPTTFARNELRENSRKSTHQ